MADLLRFFKPRHTAADVAQELVEGLQDGSIVLEKDRVEITLAQARDQYFELQDLSFSVHDQRKRYMAAHPQYDMAWPDLYSMTKQQLLAELNKEEWKVKR